MVMMGDTEVEQHWAWILLGRETTWELQELLAKSKAGICCVSQADGLQTLTRLWESLDSVKDSLLASAAKRSPRVLAT